MTGQGPLGGSGEFGAGGEAFLGALGHAPGDDRVQRGGDARSEGARAGRGLLEMALDHRDGIGGIERRGSGEEPEERAGQGVLVGAAVEGDAGELFGEAKASVAVKVPVWVSLAALSSCRRAMPKSVR